ncbi:MAG: hypothetical protein GY864_04530 [Desulfobacterales bacterium]|nr:hypothetical protein [Desulfobacterales bacterium]
MAEEKSGNGQTPPPDDRFTEDLGIAPDFQPETFEHLRKSRNKFVKAFRSILDGKKSDVPEKEGTDQDQE